MLPGSPLRLKAALIKGHEMEDMKEQRDQLVVAFASLTSAVPVDELPVVIDAVCNCFSNAIGLAMFRKLDENCDCNTCRQFGADILDGLMASTLEAVKMTINANMEASGKKPLFSIEPQDHNSQLAEEILDEIRQTENKD